MFVRAALLSFSLISFPTVAQQPQGLAAPRDFVGPVLVRRVEPTYTEEARQAGLQGAVTLYLDVELDGSPSNIQVLHGLGLGLDEMAIQAARQWRYTPGTSAGLRMKMGQSAVVNFKLEAGGPWRIRMAAYERDRRPKKSLIKVSLAEYHAPESVPCPAGPQGPIVNLEVGPDGVPRSIRLQTPSDAAGLAAAKAISTWRFKPQEIDGKKRKAKASIEIECGPSLGVAATESTSLRIGEGVTAPVAVFKPEPDYTERARKAKLQGEVWVNVVVDLMGRITNMYVIRPLGLGLDVQTVETVSRWRFNPGMNGADPVNVQATIAVAFHLL